MLIIRNVYVNAYTFCFLFLDKERDIIMELLQLVEKFKNVFSIEKIEDAVDELKSTLLNAENCRKLCEDWILICPDLTIDYMQMIFQYYFADRKEKMQDYTPKSLAVAVAELSKTKDEKICLDLCAGSGALTIQKWNENNDLKFICKEYDSRVIPFLLFNLAIRNIDAEVIHCDVLSDEIFKTYRTQKGNRFATVKEITKSEFKADCCISNPPYNMKWEQPVFAQLQNRFSQCEVPPESNANYAFVLTALDEITDKASFILPNGVLSTDNKNEKQIKKYLVEMNFVESIILCPDKMFEVTSIPMCIITFNKNKQHSTVEMIDLRQKYEIEQRMQNGQYGGASHTNRTYAKEVKIITESQVQDVLLQIEQRGNVAGYCKSVSIEEIKNNDYVLTPSRYIDFDTVEEVHRPYVDIVNDLNRVIAEKNTCKLTINETIAKSIGFDVETLKQDNSTSDGLSELTEKLCGKKIVKSDYFRTTKKKNEIVFSNNSKENISSIFMLIFNMWKQHIYYLNIEENRYLVELRDALLPELMSGKIDVSEV